MELKNVNLNGDNVVASNVQKVSSFGQNVVIAQK
jgi:hypothetical protein